MADKDITEELFGGNTSSGDGTYVALGSVKRYYRIVETGDHVKGGRRFELQFSTENPQSNAILEAYIEQFGIRHEDMREVFDKEGKLVAWQIYPDETESWKEEIKENTDEK